MKYKLFYLLVCCSFLLTMSCESSGNSSKIDQQTERIDSFDSALPHGASLTERELSDADKLKLGNALGKKAILVSLDSLQTIIQNDSSDWCLYHFWNLDCAKCLEINAYLQELKALPEIGSQLKTKYVNTVSLFPDQVNSYIRENGIVDEVYTIPADTLDNWTHRIDPGWNGEYPAILLINNSDGTRLFYQREFSKEELEAILETLTL